ncbi:rab-GTPase-TBC domain-containing protein [Zychaea mexicana]|uniref:rab-GTPase-TBC domain-containing protein n=1 Tax=Zychaea mexicana TaxID=64656 RepID=UPI0022FF252D|nr:rab-GTPase-TBC domain-containing protein [Zychaea mexicana]KAI9484875.1 rab-GTPase-TBC domain-containing protein [Zychaea mexicana]
MTEIVQENTHVKALPPQVLDKLKQLQECDRPVSVDEVLEAANLNHLTESKSTDLRPQAQAFPRRHDMVKSNSTTIAERRRIPASTEKLKLYAQISNPQQQLRISTASAMLNRFEKENAELSPQASEEYLLARLERQNALLSADPKSVCIESNRLKADFSTVRDLLLQQQQDNATSTTTTTTATAATVDWDFWEYLVDDFSGAAAKIPHLLTSKLSRGIPDRVRGVVWRAMSQSSATHLEAIYDKLVEEHSESSPYERVIQRDLSRTFPQIEMFKADGGEGQQAMGRLLRAYSVYDAHVGYCQGLAFLAGPLLMTMPEKEAFCVFVRLMETYDMRTMFTLNMEGLHLRLHQFSTLLAQLCPELDKHLAEHGIHPAMYASQWFLTLFAYSFPIDLVLRIYDLVFAEGAVETITRVAIAVMQKNQSHLLAIHDFEKLMLYLASRKLYDDAFASCDQVIEDAMALSTVITKAKVDSLAAQHQKELEQEKTRAQQVLAIRLQQPVTQTTTTKHKKRESWFSWKSSQQTQQTQQQQQQQQQQTQQQQQQQQPLSPTSPTTPTTMMFPRQQQDRSMQALHQQIEDLLLALSQLQKENSQLSEEMMNIQMRELDREADRTKVAKRNAVLEKRVKKYKLKLQQHQVEEPPMSPTTQKLEALEQDYEYRSFVDSLRGSGDFGALIAGALSSKDHEQQKHVVQEQEQQQDQKQQQDKIKQASSMTIEEEDEEEESAAAAVTDNAVNIELLQKYDEMCQRYAAVTQELETTQQVQDSLTTKTLDLQGQLETLTMERDGLLEERDAIEQESSEMEVKLAAAKKTASDLQVEKLDLAKQVEALEKQVADLEEEKRNYLMPRGSFAEEVFAAHQTLFGAKEDNNNNNNNRRHTIHGASSDGDSDEYQAKYIESDLRCRELEKLLAEAKCKLAEYESCRLNAPPRRRSTMTTKTAGRMSMPTSPCSIDQRYSFAAEPRESTDSFTSTASKRSSMYSRIWNSFGSNSTAATSPASSVAHKSPVLGSTKPIEDVVEEPQQI